MNWNDCDEVDEDAKDMLLLTIMRTNQCPVVSQVYVWEK